MKIAFTGGGTGGHFYPLIAVLEEVKNKAKEKSISDISFYFLSNTPYQKNTLDEYGVRFVRIPAGKIRTYFSIKNFLDFFIIGWGSLVALIKLLMIYPDVIFGKGGYASFPTLLAARILAIPVIIHDSDTVPGRVNKWAGRFAKKIAISWEEATNYFPANKTAVTGQPIRSLLKKPISSGSFEYFSFNSGIPVITVLGGSQGAQRINDFILDILPELVKKYQIIHQTGEADFNNVTMRAKVIFQKQDGIERYRPFVFFTAEELQRIAGITTLLVSRAGSGILEFVEWKIPSILIPIPENISRDQQNNAYAFARRGAGIVIEENNLTSTIFLSEIERIIGDKKLYATMQESLSAMTSPNASNIIAQELIAIAESHYAR